MGGTMSRTELHKPATAHTKARNATVTTPTDAGDFERASRGFIAPHPTGHIVDANGRTVINVNDYDFLAVGSPAPDTVNPSLWRHAQLNHHHGLFEVRKDVYQVRGYDISNITFLRGNTGWLVIDPLTTEQTARDSYELVTAQLGFLPVVAVIYTHSHTDHFGGVLGVTTQEEVDAGRCIVIAPEHFMHETVGENVIAGPAMGRRALFQFGPLLPAAPTGHIDCGLGNSVPIGPPGLIAPTHDITFTGEEMTVDGIRIIFQLTPESEAPAEMNFFFPDLNALCMAENCNHTMHNLIPIRGALVRNAMNWSKYINEAMELFGAQTEVVFTSHHWPRWGNEDLMGFLTNQRDLYKWMHDQTMRWANHGLVAAEIAETLQLPEEFLANDHTRGYYGDLVHNSKAVYQRYLSWYDGNPANLKKYPPVEAGQRYVELAGGADALLAKARAAFDAGDYRWVVELVNHLIFADATNLAARDLQADTFEQLGYQAESATFRNAYLNAAQELRYGPPAVTGGAGRGRGILRAMSVEQVFDTIAVRLKSEEVGGQKLFINWTFTDLNEKWVLGLSNRTLFHVQGRHEASASLTVTMKRMTLVDVVTQQTTFVDEINAGNITVDGDASALLTIFGNLDVFTPGFHIVEP
jgi:alkyl sulfatase BDS1-like metallo-beta-lactamase superfamily hydrolase